MNVGQTLGVSDVCREIVAWEDDFDRDVGDSVGLPKRAVGPMPFLVVENRAAGLVALGLDVNALDEVVDDANLLGWCRCVRGDRQVAYLVSRSLERRWIASERRGVHIEVTTRPTCHDNRRGNNRISRSRRGS